MIAGNDRGSFHFEVYEPHASSVELVADFLGKPRRLDRRSDGWWLADVDVPAGEHEFVYMVNGVGRLPDYAAHGLRLDERGDWVSLLSSPGLSEN